MNATRPCGTLPHCVFSNSQPLLAAPTDNPSYLRVRGARFSKQADPEAANRRVYRPLFEERCREADVCAACHESMGIKYENSVIRVYEQVSLQKSLKIPRSCCLFACVVDTYTTNSCSEAPDSMDIHVPLQVVEREMRARLGLLRREDPFRVAVDFALGYLNFIPPIRPAINELDALMLTVCCVYPVRPFLTLYLAGWAGSRRQRGKFRVPIPFSNTCAGTRASVACLL